MTHPGILKINELFNNKLTKDLEGIKIALNYKANFINQKLFEEIRHKLAQIGYKDISGQLDTLFCMIDAIKHKIIVIETIQDKKVKSIFTAFKKLLDSGIISFDSRVRRDIMLCVYLDNKNVNFKTNYLRITKQIELYKEAIKPIQAIISIKSIELKIDSLDLFNRIYENSKSVITNMNSRGMSTFAIASYFWYMNKKHIPKPFLNNWSNLDFTQAVISTPLYEQEASKEVKETINSLDSKFVFWAVLSELSLMTGKIQNFDKNRGDFNKIINKVLDSEGEAYLKEYLKYLKLIQSSTPISEIIDDPKSILDNFHKELEHLIRKQLDEKTTKVPSKEDIVAAIKYQFMISRILNVDFSSKRKDHLILDKITKRRVFE